MYSSEKIIFTGGVRNIRYCGRNIEVKINCTFFYVIDSLNIRYWQSDKYQLLV